ncbi:DUF637 domain-containing protein [Burkholderia glumae]|uniref:DUF637 domain-containing protein n=1 Tax=Burkholderia glumae TaxID=337 RepID=UPI00403F9B71
MSRSVQQGVCDKAKHAADTASGRSADGGMLAVAVAASLATYGAASAAIGTALGAAGGTFATASTAAGASAGLGNAVLSAAIAGVVSSSASQLVGTGKLDLGSAFEAGALAAITAGLMNGITYSNQSGLGFTTSPIASGSGVQSLGSLAGVQPVMGTSVNQAAGSTATLIEERGLAMLASGVINAGVGTAIEGGSFLSALKGSLVSEVAAVGANAIGDEANVTGSPIEAGSPAYWLAHAALGCASSAALGTGCAGGAIGGAISAGLNPIIDANGNIPPAALTAIETLVSGSVAGALGFNVQGAMTAAQNETLNNYLNHVQTANLVASLKSCAPGDTACINQVTASYQSISQQQQQQAKNCSSVIDCATVKNDTLSGYGISASDAQSYCQGSANCVSFLTGLGNQDVAAKSIATTNWNDISTAVEANNIQQALTSSGFSPTTVAVLSMVTPQDVAGAVTAENFFSGSQYTSKVLNQAASGDYHGFPQSVDAFSGNGTVTQIVGGDGVTRWKLTIPGSYNGQTGVFEYIRNPDGTINHRLFVPNR